MRIEQLEYIAAVTQYGSLRRAGEHLHVSQPALSEGVQSLERELGVILLDRRRTGSRISRQGRELLQGMVDVLEAVHRLRTAAGDQSQSARTLRIGTVNAGTAALLLPAIGELRDLEYAPSVEVLNTQQTEIHQGLAEGALDLGLVNVLAGDDVPPDLHATELAHGFPVVCCRTDHPLALADRIDIAALREHPFIAMRSGYLMHRFTHRLFGDKLPATSYSTDGAEMGKLMVAEGLGVTVLPNYSIDGDPLARAGVITWRPLANDHTTVSLLMLRRQGTPVPLALRALQDALLRRARRLPRDRIAPVAG